MRVQCAAANFVEEAAGRARSEGAERSTETDVGRVTASLERMRSPLRRSTSFWRHNDPGPAAFAPRNLEAALTPPPPPPLPEQLAPALEEAGGMGAGAGAVLLNCPLLAAASRPLAAAAARSL